MKTLRILAAALALLIGTQLMAQDGPRQPLPVPERVARTIERLKPELSLTEAQVKDITPVYTDFYTDMDKLRSGGERPSPEARQQLMATRDEKLKKILSEEQMKKLKELEEQMRQRRPNGVAMQAV